MLVITFASEKCFGLVYICHRVQEGNRTVGRNGEAKKHYYNRLITNSKNKIKPTWGIIRSIINTKSSKNVISSVSVDGKSYNRPQIMANIFNNYFLMSPNAF
jgi:hypothetical protein